MTAPEIGLRSPTYDELVEANAGLAADNDRLRSSVMAMQVEIIRHGTGVSKRDDVADGSIILTFR